MVLLTGVVLGVFVAWRVRHLGIYIALCDTLGVMLGGVAAMAYTGWVVGLVPWAHPLRGPACLAGVFLVGWLMFRAVGRSFAGEWAVDLGKTLDPIGAAVIAFAGTVLFVAMASIVVLTVPTLPPAVGVLEEPLRQAAAIAVSTCRGVAFLTGGEDTITLDRIIEQARAGM